VPVDDLEKAAGIGRVGGRIVEQRLGIAADGRERRAELVRDVGDEVAAGLICAP
jgi:hypothetical protein